MKLLFQATRRVLRLLTAFTLLSGWAAHAADLVIATGPTAFSLPLFVAEQQRLFAAEGVGVRLVDCGPGWRCLSRMLDGGADLAAVSELPVVFNAFQRDDYAVVAAIATSSANIRVLGRRSAGVVSAATLAGKRVGVPFGGSGQYYLDVYLLYHGIEPKLVKTVPVAPNEAVAAFARKDIDAFVGSSQATLPAQHSLGADGVALAAPRIYTESFNLVASRRVIDTRADDLVKVLRAIARAERWIAAQPADAVRLLQSRLDSEPGLVESLFSRFEYRLGLDPSIVGTMERQARWALREGHVPRGLALPSFGRFVAPGPLRAAVPGALQD